MSDDSLPEPEESLRHQITQVEASCKQALTEQKAEYFNLHQALQASITTLHANIEALRCELHTYVRDIVNNVNSLSAPIPNPTPSYDSTAE